MQRYNNNTEIRQAMKNYGITFWMLAEKLGVCENTAIKRFRHELPEDQKRSILSAIEEMASQISR